VVEVGFALDGDEHWLPLTEVRWPSANLRYENDSAPPGTTSTTW